MGCCRPKRTLGHRELSERLNGVSEAMDEGQSEAGGTMNEKVYEGGCLCGAVRYRFTEKPQPIIACHCRQCRQMSGHYFAATAVSRKSFELTEGRGLSWYQSSKVSRRGFCKECGSSLFFDHGEDEPIGISAGSLDHEPEGKLVAHIYVEEAGDYYTIDDQAPSFDSQEWAKGGWKSLRHN